MSEPPTMDDLPVMAFDRGQIEGCARQLAFAANLIAEARKHLGTGPLSESEAAARDHDQLQRSATEPAVRLMHPSETLNWLGQGNAQAEQRTAATADRELRIRIGGLDNGRWAVDAQIYHRNEHGAVPSDTAVMSCATEQHARELGDELLAAGPEPAVLARLTEHAIHRAQRQATAAAAVHEPAHARLTRTRQEIRNAWRPDLAERVISSTAFPAFAERLHQLEEHGTAMPDVLARLSQGALSGTSVRDPARLACWMCDNLLTVVDGEVITPHQPQRRPSPRPTTDAAAEGASAGTRAGEVDQSWLRAIEEDTVWPALRAALPEPLCQRLRGSDGYDTLVNELAGKTTTGWSLDALLAHLPAELISRAADPARYLSAVVDQRARRNPPERTGADKVAMAVAVREAMPPDLAQRVLDCPAWPALANRMAHTEATARRGEPPLAQLLAQMPLDAIGDARKPAAYTAQLLTRHVAARRGERPPTSPSAPDRDSPLDATSAVDRVALEDSAPTQILGPDPGAAASHLHAAEQDAAMAGDAERDAGYERTESADHRFTRASEAAAEGLARIDDNLAAGYRADAAEQLGSAAAAALRAQVVLTPPSAVPATSATLVSRSSTARTAGPVRTPRNSTPDRTRTR